MGRPRKQRKKVTEPKPKLADDLTPPDHLDVVAKKEWNRIGPELRSLGLLTVADLPLFENYCSAYSDFVRCSKALRRGGLTTKDGSKLRPEFYAKRNAFLVIIRACAELGMTPSARARMSVEIKPATPKHKLLKALDGETDANVTVQ